MDGGMGAMALASLVGKPGGGKDKNYGAIGNIAEGNKEMRPAQHSEYRPMQAAPLQSPMEAPLPVASAPQMDGLQELLKVATRRGSAVEAPQIEGQPLDDYAAEELRRREAAMNTA